METIDTGRLISEMTGPLMTKAKLARLLGVTQPTATRMLTTKTMQTDSLVMVSKKLNYNFFRVIGERLGIAEPYTEDKEARERQLKELTDELERVKEENRYLKKAIDLLGGRG